jgi:hypothetical protein
MTLYQIERNIPLVQISKPPRVRKYPFRELNKGDSFFVPVHDTKTIPRVRSAAWAWREAHGGKFKTRAVDGGIRVWRVK